MTYDAYEKSVESGSPVELYDFAVGTDYYRYTSSPDTISFGGNTYLPRQITRSAPSQSNENSRIELEVSLPTEDDVASRFIGIIPGTPMTLEITRYHRNDGNAYILWSGVILGASYSLQGALCTLRGITGEASFSRPIPRFKYQSLCNHVLFDEGCQVAKASFTHTGTCSAVNGNDITVDDLYATFPSADWAKGGYASFNDSDFRLINAQSGDTVTLFLPFENNPLGQTVKVFAGCDHSLSTCSSKFSNVINFGGFPNVPPVNPFSDGII